VPISSAGEFSMFLAIAPTIPAKDLAEFLDLVAANPGKYTSASSNSAAELAMLQLLSTPRRQGGQRPLQGRCAGAHDLASGQISMIFSTGTLMPTFVKEGKARALVTLLPKRSPLLPDVPTAAELGRRQADHHALGRLLRPAGLPADTTEKLSAGLRAALARPDVRDQLVAQGFSQLRHDAARVLCVLPPAVRRLRRDRAREQRQVRLRRSRPVRAGSAARAAPYCTRDHAEGTGFAPRPTARACVSS
jgi:tripartite-type tricarboxylate transporter receptor subunit TctC